MTQSPEQGILSGKAVVRGVTPEGVTAASTASGPAALFSGFLDEDGHIDLSAVGRGGEVDLFAGDGAGSFIPKFPPCPNLPLFPEMMRQGDLNQDGRTDLVVIGGGVLAVFFGDREGCYEKSEEFSSGNDPDLDLPGVPTAFQIIDLTGDGFIDLLVATDSEKPLVRLANKGDGAFKIFLMEGRCGTAPVSVLARQNGTRLIDIVIADAAVGVCAITYNADETALAPIIFSLPTPLTPDGIKAIETAFLDADATPDLLVLHTEGGARFLGPPPTESVPLEPAFTLPAGFNLQSARFLDLNRDRRNDLVAAGQGGVRLLLGNGDGTFDIATAISPLSTPLIALADFNEDGKVDLAGAQGSDIILFMGEDSAQAGVRVEAKDASGALMGTVFYVDPEGKIQGEKTGASGRFIIFNVPPGASYIRVSDGGSGNVSVTSYEGGLTFFHLNMNPIAPMEVAVEGQVINPTAGEFAGIDVRDIAVIPVGTGKAAVSGEEGSYRLTLGANSEYTVKLDP